MIRPARPGDAPALHAIWTPVIRETTSIFHTTERSPEEIAALTTGPDPFLVWEDDGSVQGFARCFTFRAGNGYTRTVEHTILLAPEAQGRGDRPPAHRRLGRSPPPPRASTAMIGAISAENTAGLAFHAPAAFGNMDACRRWATSSAAGSTSC